jgi:uncharacterized protein (DUF1330 family)/ADP-ribose pyrophosphatase YjhB (NUDIX family)
MGVYQLTEFRVTDRDALGVYAETAGELVAEHGGRLLATSYSPPCEVVEGDWDPGTVVFIHGWPSREAFRRFYDSDRYQAARRHRLRGSSHGRLLLFDATAPDAHAVRPVAAAVMRRSDRLLVWEDRNPDTGELVSVPLTGGIEFGEPGADAIARELHEEIGATATRIDYLGALEDIYDWGAARRHELYLVYDVDVAEPEIYESDELTVVEPDGRRYVARWRPLHEFRGERRLVPDGLLALIDSRAVPS